MSQQTKEIEIRVHASVPGGVRRRAGLTFTTEWSRHPAADVPQAVLDDPHLVKRPTASPSTASRAEPSKTGSKAAQLEELTELKNIGPGTADKLLAIGATRSALAEGTADATKLLELYDTLGQAQQDAVLEASSPELRELLKAERIQQPGQQTGDQTGEQKGEPS